MHLWKTFGVTRLSSERVEAALTTIFVLQTASLTETYNRAINLMTSFQRLDGISVPGWASTQGRQQLPFLLTVMFMKVNLGSPEACCWWFMYGGLMVGGSIMVSLQMENLTASYDTLLIATGTT